MICNAGINAAHPAPECRQNSNRPAILLAGLPCLENCASLSATASGQPFPHRGDFTLLGLDYLFGEATNLRIRGAGAHEIAPLAVSGIRVRPPAGAERREH